MIKNFFFRNKSESESIAVLKMVNPEFDIRRYYSNIGKWLYVGINNGECRFCNNPDLYGSCIIFKYVPTKEQLEDYGIIEKKKTFADLNIGDYYYMVEKSDGNIKLGLKNKACPFNVFKKLDYYDMIVFSNKSDAIAEQHRILQSIFDEKLREFKDDNKDLIEILDIKI